MLHGLPFEMCYYRMQVGQVGEKSKLPKRSFNKNSVTKESREKRGLDFPRVTSLDKVQHDVVFECVCLDVGEWVRQRG